MMLYCACFAAQILALPLPSLGAGRDSLRLTIELLEAPASQGRPETLRIMLWNDTGSALELLAPLNWPNERLMLEITGPDGQQVDAYNFVFANQVPVGPTAAFATRIPPHSFVGRDVQLCPGAGTGQPGYDLSKPGSYRAVLTLDVYPTAGGRVTTLRSNMVQWVVR